jgi:hypothetical protein
MAPRWDGDERGDGVADAARLVPGAGELLAAFGEPNWVTEQPEVHLLPHVEAWCQRDRRLAVIDAYTDDTGAFVLNLGWNGASRGVGRARAAAFSLIGSFAESATYVRQRRVASDSGPSAMMLQFEVGTGELAPEAGFAPHGHVVLITVTGVL